MQQLASAIRVLVVCDEAGAAREVRDLVELGGHDCRVATDGSQVRDVIGNNPVDVIIATDAIPGMTAPDFCRLIRRLDEDRAIAPLHLIVLSAMTNEQAMGEALEAGADAFLAKPIKASELKVALRAARRILDLERRVIDLESDLLLLARTDAVTGIPNRGYLEEVTERLLSGDRRHGMGLAALMIDIDRFRAINDEYGYEVGDLALRAVVERLQSCKRTEDVLGRWSADRFLLLLPYTDFGGATLLAERMREAVERDAISLGAIPLSTSRSAAVTISIGCAITDHDAFDTLISRAETALFRAKAGGRNLVAG